MSGARVQSPSQRTGSGFVRVKLNDCPVAIDDHDIVHGMTPLSSSHLRMPATAPLSVSGEGCGRWNTRISPNRNMATRDPSRSSTSAPSAWIECLYIFPRHAARRGAAEEAGKCPVVFAFHVGMVLLCGTAFNAQRSACTGSRISVQRAVRARDPCQRERPARFSCQTAPDAWRRYPR